MNLAELRCKPEDEFPHVPQGDDSLPWKDTWYFSAWDADADLHLAMHMTVSANRRPDTRVAIGARLNGRERVVVCREDGYRDERRVGNRLAGIEALHLSWDAQHRLRWHGETAELAFDLVVTGLHLAADFHALFPGVNPSGQQGHSYSHTEQVIRAEGRVQWKAEPERAFKGLGWRDRGWGRRKNDLTFATGYDLVAALLPDGSAFALSAMRNVEHAADAPLPVYGFHATAATISPAIGGIYYKDSLSFPTELDLQFADGSCVRGRQLAPGSTLGTPFHDAEPQLSGIAVAARDAYARFADAEGRPFIVFSNEGHAHRANVTRDAKFFYRDDAWPAATAGKGGPP